MEDEEHLTLDQARQERSASLLAMCTLGISAVPFKIVAHEAKESPKGLSFEKDEGLSFVFRIFIFLLLYVISAIPLWFYHTFRFIDHSIYIKRLEQRGI